MNIAVILAGGNGSRTEQDVPKQFISVYEKPIIIYTLETFERHPDIDAIIVSCLEGWQEILTAYAREAGITKLRWIVAGGENGQASARMALLKLEGVCEDKDIVIIHDAIRPMVTADIISDCIVKCKMHGSGLAAIPCQETIIASGDKISGTRNIDRKEIMRVQTPQAYWFRKALDAHMLALEKGITNSVYTNTLMLELGDELFFAKGSEKNIKITTIDDIEMFKAIYKIKREDWMK